MVRIVKLESTMTNNVRNKKKTLLRTIPLRQCEQKYKFLGAEQNIFVLSVIYFKPY